ncbi:MAG TPA: four helix bundle protein [Gemmataceae bacterium]|nr:four helix bundle protein [Gemmataceae bacterium]
MATIQRFEDIQAWQVARTLTQKVYAFSNSGAFARDFGLRDQTRRAAVSILSNIAEGFERGGDAEFLHFLAIAKGSSGEIRSQLYVALDQGYMAAEQFEELHEQTVQISRLLSGLMSYLRNSGLKGSKFK